MTEADLHQYMEVKEAYLKAKEILQEFTLSTEAPGTTCYSPLPPAEGFDDTQPYAIMQRKEELRQDVERLSFRLAYESTRMQEIYFSLPPREARFFIYKWMYGYPTDVIEKKMRKSRETLRRIKRSVLEKVQNISV